MLIVSEEKFLEIFQGIQHKGEVENKIKELARSLYNIAFEWVIMKINQRMNIYAEDLVRLRLEKVKKSQKNEEILRITGFLRIAIIDFPGFHNSPTLGGFTSNLAFECLNLFASDKLISLQNSLNSDKICMKILKTPISKDLISVLMSKQSGLLQNLDLDNFEKY